MFSFCQYHHGQSHRSHAVAIGDHSDRILPFAILSCLLNKSVAASEIGSIVVFLMMILGLATLTVGAECLVRGASKLAVAMGVPPLVVALTVVACGTSAPEFVVSAQAILRGEPDITVGNVVGSNILNVLIILGLSAVIIPLTVSRNLIRFDVPLMIAVSLLVPVLAWDGMLGQLEGGILALGLVAYIIWTVIKGRAEERAISARERADAPSDFDPVTAPPGLRIWLVNGFLFLAGLGLLILGSQWFVDAAIEIARQFGVPELVIGLTIVSLGTSAPEIATSIVAAFRGEGDIAVGNAIGSNLFNLLGVLGVSGLISSGGIPIAESAMRLDIPVMIATAIACLPIFFTGHRIDRWEGALFLMFYAAYTTTLVLAAIRPDWTRPFAWVMLGLVVPLTTITLIIGVVRAIRGGNGVSIDHHTRE